jgi:hypothetical protein
MFTHRPVDVTGHLIIIIIIIIIIIMQQSLRRIRKANNDYKPLSICPTVCPKKAM